MKFKNTIILGILAVAFTAPCAWAVSECVYKFTVGSLALIDKEYQVDPDATYIVPDSALVRSIHGALKKAGYPNETQDALSAAVWVDLTASVKQLENGVAHGFYQVTVKNNLTSQFSRVSENLELPKFSKVEDRIKKKITKTPKLMKEDVGGCSQSGLNRINAE